MKYTFEVGKEYVCTCGNSCCLPFIVVEFDNHLIGIDTDGAEAIYTQDDYHMIRPLTKLEKALK